MPNTLNPTERQAGGVLPRLAYVGDVPVEADMQGPTLLYRLFQTYPRDRLLIVEGRKTSLRDRRIGGVTYRQYHPRWRRLLPGRFHAYASPALTLRAPAGAGGVAKLVRDFRPEAVITVASGYVWPAAAAYAERHELPLHLIVHDDWPNIEDFGRLDRRWRNVHLQRWYPTAASRLCVSPYMAEEYGRRYGGEGDVLYPSRGIDGLCFDDPPDSLGGPCEPYTVAFAGSIYWEYARALQRMAVALQRFAGRLIVYGRGADRESCPFLREPNIELRGMVNSTELIQQCRRDAHAVFVPMSYRAEDRTNAELSFPSKLADFTVIGIPLVIDGPAYCSAVRWARENPGVAEVIDDETVEALAASIVRLQERDYRVRLAKKIIACGRQYFDPGRAITLFHERLNRAEVIRGTVPARTDGSIMVSEAASR